MVWIKIIVQIQSAEFHKAAYVDDLEWYAMTAQEKSFTHESVEKFEQNCS